MPGEKSDESEPFSLFGSRHRGSHPDGWAALWPLLKLNDVAYADDMKGLRGSIVK